ncbi:MAG: arginine repressor [Clostridia bacterium]
MKFRRQAKIIELIDKCEIETQEELTAKLLEAGFETTQATVSRDIKELRLVKSTTPAGISKYAVASSTGDGSFSVRLKKIFKESVIKIDIAQNIVVVKTLPGLGSAAAASIDSLKSDEIVGSLAGDDTVFIAMKDNEAAQIFANTTKKMLS